MAKPLPQHLRGKWLPKQEAADLLDVSVTTLDRYRRKGLFECRRFRGQVLFKRDHLLRFLNHLEFA